MSQRHLTKSRFKTGHECPTKLHFLDNKAYGNSKDDNSFLEALAEGGFQVGELAKLYHSGGTDIDTLDKAKALRQTNELLKLDNVVIYEAAIQFENLFIRADILIKEKNRIQLIEVKAKSFDSHAENPFYTKTSVKKGKPEINSEWESYLIDLAFQCYVTQKAFPKFEIEPFLMLADKRSVASVDGLNQLFILEEVNGRVRAKVAPGTTREKLGAPVLIQVSAAEQVELLHNAQYEKIGKSMGFGELINVLSEACASRSFVEPDVGTQCKSCEFRISPDTKVGGLKSGFEECWKKSHGLKDTDFQRDFVFEIWNFRKAQKLIENGKLFIDQLEESDVSPSNSKEAGLSSSERQWLQVRYVKEQRSEPYLDARGLAKEMSSWVFPLHFIDFETTMVAIPFHSGRRPYEQIAFQFSHHVVHSDGKIEHADEFIHCERGSFPNFEFLRALKKCLEKDEGTIFRFATHENTVLCQIKEQIKKYPDAIPDKDELIAFIESITRFETDDGEIVGERCMIDMCDLVKKYFYHPSTKGSNSIKKVLPAVLACSQHLQTKYSQPTYGTKEGISSKNFAGWQWVKKNANGAVIDPYKILPPIFADVTLEQMDSLILEGSIADGGAAMTAFARMQFTQMSEQEHQLAVKALLKYCELDTFAMVLIYEYWKNEIEKLTAGKAA